MLTTDHRQGYPQFWLVVVLAQVPARGYCCHSAQQHRQPLLPTPCRGEVFLSSEVVQAVLADDRRGPKAGDPASVASSSPTSPFEMLDWDPRRGPSRDSLLRL
eukprot:gnl/TRDRNA2_/TRDRNA2_81306_c1_seq1.p2 gnl/TRDRNA2_/TRDRNA2_81306_c1~~gnl/TRDRNA2_/TRDRNA2_81306_c1_seq1.p2  ORF type:complete len:103 (-),score=10.80 gnl/TRDRNA2_/TRDRNA2_81306_c1_seq1:180-488(-)